MNRARESIAELRQRFDVTLAVGSVSQRLAHQRDVMVEVALFDKRIRPEFGNEFGFRDGVTVLLDEQDEGLKGFRRQSDRLIVAQELALSRDEAETAKFIHDGGLVGHSVFSGFSVVKILAFSGKLNKNFKTNSRPFSYLLAS